MEKAHLLKFNFPARCLILKMMTFNRSNQIYDEFSFAYYIESNQKINLSKKKRRCVKVSDTLYKFSLIFLFINNFIFFMSILIWWEEVKIPKNFLFLLMSNSVRRIWN